MPLFSKAAVLFLALCGSTTAFVPSRPHYPSSPKPFDIDRRSTPRVGKNTRMWVSSSVNPSNTLQDFYNILNLSLNAGTKEIKAAYRRLAKQYHPDVNPHPSAKEVFQEINEAYQVLMNPETEQAREEHSYYDAVQTPPPQASTTNPHRREYEPRKEHYEHHYSDEDIPSDWSNIPFDVNADFDQRQYQYASSVGVDAGFEQQQQHASPFEQHNPYHYEPLNDGTVNFEEYTHTYEPPREDTSFEYQPPVDTSFEQQQRQHIESMGSFVHDVVLGNDLKFDLDIDFRTAIFGGHEKVRIRHMATCGCCHGHGVVDRPATCSECGGNGVTTKSHFGNFRIVTCSTCKGSGKEDLPQTCETCHGHGTHEQNEEIQVTIPPGVEDGVNLRVCGEGDLGVNGEAAGDLYVNLHVKEDPAFRRVGTEIYSEQSLSYLDAICGASIRVPVVNGAVTVKIPPGTRLGQTIRLKGNGAPIMGDIMQRGDHVVTLNFDIPDERELMEKLREKDDQLRP